MSSPLAKLIKPLPSTLSRLSESAPFRSQKPPMLLSTNHPLFFSSAATPDTSTDKPQFRVAIVGAGPAGFYTAKYLLQDYSNSSVDVFDCLPTPFGLVRSGVAPDHPEVKLVQNDFTKILADNRCSFFGNVRIGKDIHVSELSKHYHAVVLSYGAASDRSLKFLDELEKKGQKVQGVHSAREFVNWYNGHPDYRDSVFDLSGKTAVIIGNGNVAIDVARILLAPIEMLSTTDICDHALQALKKSTINKVVVVGRRGPVQSAFTIKELREFTKLEDVTTTVSESDMKLGKVCKEEVEARALKRRHELLETCSGNDTSKTNKSLELRYFLSPVGVDSVNIADPQTKKVTDKVAGVRCVRTELSGTANEQKCHDTADMVGIAADIVFTRSFLLYT